MNFVFRSCAWCFLSLLVTGLAVPRSVAARTDDTEGRAPRNIILLIGDGMGPQQIALLRLFGQALRAGVPLPEGRTFPRSLALERLLERAATGIAFPEGESALVVDSACAGTALAAGEVVAPGVLGLRRDGSRVETVVEVAERLGMATGLVSDTRITHATPAAFVAQVAQRSSEHEIARQILASNVDVLLSAGRDFFPSPGSRSVPSRLHAVGLGAQVGESPSDGAGMERFHLLHDRRALEAATKTPVLGLFAPDAMPDGITEYASRNDPGRTIPTLTEMTQHALRLLTPSENGFFLMVEAGQIDWAGHANDAGWLLYEMVRFDGALREILDWMTTNPDTLLIVTADHETGSFGFSYRGESGGLSAERAKRYDFGSLDVFTKLLAQKRPLRESIKASGSDPDRLRRNLTADLPFIVSPRTVADIVRGLSAVAQKRSPCDSASAVVCPFYPDSNNYLTALVARELSSQQGIVWGTGTHTSTPVGVYAVGAPHLTARFAGAYPQVEVGRRLKMTLEARQAAHRRQR